MSGEPLKNFWYTQEEKLAIWQTLDLTEAGVKQSVEDVFAWFEKQPHLAGAVVDKMVLEKFLIMSKGSVEQTKQIVDKFYRYRTWAPELIQDRDKILNSGKFYETYGVPNLPNLYEGKRVFFLTLTPNLTSVNAEEFFKKSFMVMDLRLKYDYWLSDIWVYDLRHGSVALMLSLKIETLMKTAKIFQNGTKWRIEAIHLVNIPVSTTALQYSLDFFKQFVSSTIMERIVIHDSLESLYQHIPKEYIPEDLGGTAPSMNTLLDSLEKVMKDPKNQEVLFECSKMVSNEIYRPKDVSIQELAGSFKKLEFD